MKKSIALCFIVCVFPSIVFAQTSMVCTDITVNLYKGLESSSVLKLQNFLSAKGFLKAKPNGYFGPGTMAAVKQYQKSVGITQTGSVATLTRARIKKDSCGTTGATVIPSSTTVSKPVTTTTPTVPVAKTTLVETPKAAVVTKNEQRRKDITALLQALAQRFRDTRVHSLAVNETPIELCVKPVLVATIASTTDGTRLVTPDSPCKEYIDIAYLAPSYLSTIPRDPTLASSSVLIGYTISRSDSNDITIAAKTVDSGAIIKVSCNFNAGCPTIDQISTIRYQTPYITSIERPIFLRGTIPKLAPTIVGKGFTKKNAVTLQQRNSSREYYLGEFSSTNGTTTSITPSALNQKFSCGTGCLDDIPVGEYMVIIKNEGGTSNAGYISIKSHTTATVSSHGDRTITPKTVNVKIGSITLSSDIPLTLKSLTLVATTTTNKKLSAKITKFVLKDPMTNTTIASAGTAFTFPNTLLSANESKILDIYADFGDIFVEEFGRMTYSGTVLAKDTLLGTDLEFPVKEFSFTVSY